MPACIKNKKGFTLIELLVVIAIIALLASVIFASVNSARIKAKDAALKESMAQLVNLANLNYNDYGNYSYLQQEEGSIIEWLGSVAGGRDCGIFSDNGTYGPNAVAICNDIISKAAGVDGTNFRLYAGTSLNDSQKYSFFVVLNKANNLGIHFIYCVGSSGAKGEYEYNASMWSSAGCPQNP